MIKIRGISKSFDRKIILSNQNLEIFPNTFLLLTGASGEGKSTFLKILAGYELPESGFISLSPNDKIAFIFQNYNLIDDYTVYENLELSLMKDKSTTRNQRNFKIQESLSKLQLHNIQDKKVKLLSGGEQQRVAIARSILMNANIIIADEPTASVDNVNKQIILKYFSDFAESGNIVIAVSHDETYKNFATKIISLSQGKINNEDR